MKNPWMSMWLSAANKITGPARGQIMAEMTKAQTKAMKDAQKAWLSMWGLGKSKGGGRKK
ncbi:MAG: hypothetical protein Q4G49_04385 [Paracoccus sp. (in: a-proteobacteria)]|nr:hypothetical protein [Paracoccus sp. (in: a-proteobacteria)]